MSSSSRAVVTGADAPDNVWLFVITFLYDDEGDWHDMASLRTLSTSNRRFRGLVLPFLFRAIEIIRDGQLDRLREVIRKSPQCSGYIRKISMNTSPYRQSADNGKVQERTEDLISLGKQISKRLKSVEIIFGNEFDSDSQLRFKAGLRNFFRHAKRIDLRFRRGQKCDLEDLQYYLVEAKAVNELWIESHYGIIQPPGLRFDYLPRTVRSLILDAKFSARSVAEAVLQLPNLRQLTLMDVSFSGEDVMFFADALSTNVHNLFSLHINAHRFETPNPDLRWEAELPRMLRAGYSLMDLQLCGTAVCTANIVRGIPPTLLVSLRMDCTSWAQQNRDDSQYEDFCSAVFTMQKSTIILRSIEIYHAFVQTKERDEEVQGQLRSKMRMGRATFESAFLVEDSSVEEDAAEHESDTESDEESQSDVDNEEDVGAL